MENGAARLAVPFRLCKVPTPFQTPRPWMPQLEAYLQPPAIEYLCASIPRYNIVAMSGTFLVRQSPFGAAGTRLFYGNAAEPNQLQP